MRERYALYNFQIRQSHIPKSLRHMQNQNEPEVNLCVKVPKSLRQHWAAEAKRQGTTMTAVIMAALKDRFGKPD